MLSLVCAALYVVVSSMCSSILCCSFLAVELMRGGVLPLAACRAAVLRTKRHYPQFFGAIICTNTTGHHGECLREDGQASTQSSKGVGSRRRRLAAPHSSSLYSVFLPRSSLQQAGRLLPLPLHGGQPSVRRSRLAHRGLLLEALRKSNQNSYSACFSRHSKLTLLCLIKSIMICKYCHVNLAVLI